MRFKIIIHLLSNHKQPEIVNYLLNYGTISKLFSTNLSQLDFNKNSPVYILHLRLDTGENKDSDVSSALSVSTLLRNYLLSLDAKYYSILCFSEGEDLAMYSTNIAIKESLKESKKKIVRPDYIKLAPTPTSSSQQDQKHDK